MSLRHVSGGYLQRYTAGSSDGIPQIAASTVCGWFTRRVDRNAASCWLLLRGEGTTGQYAGIYTTPSDDSVGIGSTWGTAGTITKTWIDSPTFVAMVCSGTAITVYTTEMGNPDSFNFYSTTVSVSGDPQFNMLRIGDDSYGAWTDGESHGVMAWARALTTAELAAQRRHRTPIDRTGLLFWLPEVGATAAEQAMDMSGAGRHFSVVGSPVVATPADVVINWSLNR